MAKRFYCKDCKAKGSLGEFSTLAQASIDDTGEIVYFCRVCNRRVQIVEKPCEHEWDVTKTHRICRWVIKRTCRKCGLRQEGVEPATDIAWHDA